MSSALGPTEAHGKPYDLVPESILLLVLLNLALYKEIITLQEGYGSRFRQPGKDGGSRKSEEHFQKGNSLYL
ncbi:hypothetical protein XELAEV_18000951mg [Xenopus laevis]|nr:hypothetical protein XELAEV_18000951mg [Xenopus laevis]